MTPWVATHSDLHLSGLTPSACRPDARALGSINLVTGLLQIDGHGFDGGEMVRFSVGDPSPLRSLPSGIVAGTYYPVLPTNGNPDFFQVYTVPGTAPPSILVPTDAGQGAIYVDENYIPKIDRVMASWTSVLLAKAVAYKPPWYVPPTWAPMMVAKLAAPTVASVLRVSIARYPVPEVAAGYEWAQKELRFLEAGGLYNDGTGPIDASSNTGTYDTARASSGVSTGRICDMAWVTGTL